MIGVLLAAFTLLFFFGAPLGRSIGRSLELRMRFRDDGAERARELAALKAECAVCNVSGKAPISQGAFPAFIYSRYPFNFKDELLVSAGSALGIQRGDVAIAEGFFLGLVEKTYSQSALVRTVFDARMRFAVRIGEQGADALLVGGSVPRATLISKDAEVQEGDVVYAVGAGIPYGVTVGTLSRPAPSANSLFKESAVLIPLNPGDLVMIEVVPSPQSE